MSKVQNLSVGWEVLEVWKVWIHEKHDDITPMETSACHRKTFWSKKDKTTFTFTSSFLLRLLFPLKCTLYNVHCTPTKFFDNIFVGPEISLHVYSYEYVWQVLRNFAATARQFPNFPSKKENTKTNSRIRLIKLILFWYRPKNFQIKLILFWYRPTNFHNSRGEQLLYKSSTF